MTNVVPVYPSGLLTWTDRVDNVSVDFAGDINTVASDLISVETTLGANPQVEPNPPSGPLPVTYSTVSARITDAMNNNQLPAVSLSVVNKVIKNNDAGEKIAHNVNYDPFGMYNGTDITIPTNGWWLATTVQTWDWWSDGYSHHRLTLNGAANILADSLIDWTFSGNLPGVTGGALPRWQRFGKRSRTTQVHWQGLLHAGDVISVISENGTSNAGLTISASIVKMSMLRKVSGTFVSG